MAFTEENILSLAPDPGTGQRAKTVAIAQRWLRLEGNGRAIWGELGNPADPYRTKVDFTGMAAVCTCPVRRQPCKHGIGLMLLFAKNNDAFRLVQEPPDWVASWLKKRDERFTKTETPATAPATETEIANAEKRSLHREKRLHHMEGGLIELENWLADLFRQGLAMLEDQADAYWNELSARLVDAKLGAIARRIRQLPLLMHQPGWHEKVLAELGDIYLLAKGFQRMEHLPEPLQDDLLSLAGVNLKKEDVLARPGLQDHWLVAGQMLTEEEGNLLARRTWLLGEKTRHTCLLLDFAWGNNAFETSWRPGSVLSGEVAFYPSAYPQRVVFKKFEWTDASFNMQHGYPTISAFAKSYAEALAVQPWLSPFPAFLENTVPVFHQKNFVLVDAERKQLPLRTDELQGWKLVAMSAGQSMSVFGQWDGEALLPLSVFTGSDFRLLEP